MRSSSYGAALLALCACAACLVKDVELRDRLPSDEGAAQGGSAAGSGHAQAGTNGDGEAGDPSSSDQGGTDQGGADQGGTDQGGTDKGGSDSGIGAGVGGTAAGSGGKAGSTGSGGRDNPGWIFSGKSACGTPEPLFCDDFEQDRPANWEAGPAWQRKSVAGAPSPSHVMETGFNDATIMKVGATPSSFNLSFWVRFPSKTDQPFVTFPVGGSSLFLGVEESVFRFRLDANPPVIAPEQFKYTRGVKVDTWTCVELEVDNNEWNATVTVFGEQPFALATLGGKPDAGIDQKLLEAIPGQALVLDAGNWILGDHGTDIQFDDVRITTPGEASVCSEFLEANQ